MKSKRWKFGLKPGLDSSVVDLASWSSSFVDLAYIQSACKGPQVKSPILPAELGQ